MNTFKAICFDWGGVICLVPGGSFITAAANFLGVPKEEFSKSYFVHNHLVNKGPNAKSYEEAHEMWSMILTDLGFADRHSAFMDFVRAREPGKVDGRMLVLIGSLKKSGWKTGLLSNMSLSGADQARTQMLDILFDAVCFSAEIGYMKPEPGAFEELAKRLDVKLNELIFIDDSPRSLETAPQLGYTPILFTSYETLLVQLAELGIQVA